jgi:hypothetical protein
MLHINITIYSYSLLCTKNKNHFLLPLADPSHQSLYFHIHLYLVQIYFFSPSTHQLISCNYLILISNTTHNLFYCNTYLAFSPHSHSQPFVFIHFPTIFLSFCLLKKKVNGTTQTKSTQQPSSHTTHLLRKSLHNLL